VLYYPALNEREIPGTMTLALDCKQHSPNQQFGEFMLFGETDDHKKKVGNQIIMLTKEQQALKNARSERFENLKAARRPDIDLCAKLQLGQDDTPR
jgi:hypothetical protein